MLCASSVSINPWHCQHFSELGLASLWGLWIGPMEVDIVTASLEPLQVLPCPVGPMLASSTQPSVTHSWECHKCHPGLFTAPEVTWGSARFKCLQ